MGVKPRTFSAGFKRARKEAQMTQKSFCIHFKEYCGREIPLETVRNWEQNRNTPEIKTIETLCGFFSKCFDKPCSMDYLFDRIDCKNHDLQFIQDRTGLSEKSIEKIVFRNPNRRGENSFLDTLISSDAFYDLDQAFSQLQSVIKWFNSCTSGMMKCEAKSKTLDPDSQEYKENDKLYFDQQHSAQRWEAEQVSNIYRMGLLFGNLLEEYRKSNLKVDQENGKY